jgi:lysozyme
MKTSINGLNLIKKYEGCVLYAYDDAKVGNNRVNPGQKVSGTLTIGYGHTNAAGEPKVFPGQTITQSEAETILSNDLIPVENQVTNLVKVTLNQNQFDALVSFQYNTGSLGKSSVLKYLNNGDYQKAADSLMLYTKGRVNGQLVPMKGLVTRRTEERSLFLAPVKTTTSGTVAAGTVAAGTAGAAATAPHHLLPWIIAGGFILALVAFVAFDIYSYKQWKKTNAVA